MSAYGNKLNPYRNLREPYTTKGNHQSVVITNNPSTIDKNQQFLARAPTLGSNDIVPRTACLAFTIELNSKDVTTKLSDVSPGKTKVKPGKFIEFISPNNGFVNHKITFLQTLSSTWVS